MQFFVQTKLQRNITIYGVELETILAALNVRLLWYVHL